MKNKSDTASLGKNGAKKCKVAIDTLKMDQASNENMKKSDAVVVQQNEIDEIQEKCSTSVEIDQQPSSTTMAKQLPIVNVEEYKIIWTGQIDLVDVAPFHAVAFPISGDSLLSEQHLPDKMQVIGRVRPKLVWDYIEKAMRWKKIVPLCFHPQTDDDAAEYDVLVNHLDSRDRFGVIKSTMAAVKDLYILPLLSHEPVPKVLAPIIVDKRWPAKRSNLLLGIAVVDTSIIVPLFTVSFFFQHPDWSYGYIFSTPVRFRPLERR